MRIGEIIFGSNEGSLLFCRVQIFTYQAHTRPMSNSKNRFLFSDSSTCTSTRSTHTTSGSTGSTVDWRWSLPGYLFRWDRFRYLPSSFSSWAGLGCCYGWPPPESRARQTSSINVAVAVVYRDEVHRKEGGGERDIITAQEFILQILRNFVEMGEDCIQLQYLIHLSGKLIREWVEVAFLQEDKEEVESTLLRLKLIFRPLNSWILQIQ